MDASTAGLLARRQVSCAARRPRRSAHRVQRRSAACLEALRRGAGALGATTRTGRAARDGAITVSCTGTHDADEAVAGGAMYSKARIAGHPIHPMIVAFP